MRFPRVSELDTDQLKLYEGAPSTGNILVIGPPGTGKTVIAFHRAGFLLRRRQSPKVIMFNNVLKQFTEMGRTIATDVPVSTQYQWLKNWWFSATGSRSMPTLGGDKFAFDWERIQCRLVPDLAAGRNAGRADWGHLIIDEGQDFPERMYIALKAMMLAASLHKDSGTFSLTVLADDNQRLQPDKNCTVEMIRKALGLHAGDKNVFALKKNYRNTYEIARFARNFYAGLSTGIPDLPRSRHGDPPVISVSNRGDSGKDLNAFVEKISLYAKAHPTEEVGVLVPNNKVRKSMVNRLSTRLSAAKINVQTYSTEERNDLAFDEPGHVTVLNFASGKGLEFDAVFFVEPGISLANGGATELGAKMLLYVMCSRARTFLNMMLIKDVGSDAILGWVPDKNQYEMEAL